MSTGWVATGNGLLVVLPSNGQITSGAQLFGNATQLPNGTTAVNGFQALAQYDTSGSGVIDASNPIFSQLGVWVQTSTDGSGKLESLSSLGIVSLNLNAQVSNTLDNGNVIGLASTFTMANGQTYALDDVWFHTAAAAATGITPTTNGVSAGLTVTATSDLSALNSTEIAMLTTQQISNLSSTNVQSLQTTQIAELSTAQVAALGTAQIGSLTNADVQAMTTSQIAALSSSQLNALTVSELKTLRNTALQSSVSSLVQAINTTIRNDLGEDGGWGNQDQTSSTPGTWAGKGSTSTSVANLVSVMSQFDANGQLTSGNTPSGSSIQSPTQTSVAKLKALDDPSGLGLLTTGRTPK